MQVSTTFSLLFWINKAKINHNKAPIWVRITVNGVRAEMSIKRNIDPNDWNTEKGQAKGKKEETKNINHNIAQIRTQLYQCYQSMITERKLVTAEAIKNKYLGKEETSQTLMTLIEHHNIQLKNNLEHGTMKNYITTQKYLQLFLKDHLKTSDIYLSQLTYKFIADFELYIKNYQPLDYHKPCGQNTVMKHIERFRKIINIAIKYEWLEKDPFAKFKPVFTKTNKEFLSAQELAKIENKQFSIQRLQYVKDLFVFSCYTGLSYIDVMNLTPNNLSLGIDNRFWIYTTRQKTDDGVRIPLLPTALSILKKYETSPQALAQVKLFPTISNQKLNSYLKEIADLCGIQKNLTFHLARHTFATTITLTNGVPIETVSKLLGHNSIRTTQIYAKVIDKKVSEDMDNLQDRLFPIKLKKEAL